MSIDQQYQKSYETFNKHPSKHKSLHSLLPNPDNIKTDRERSSSHTHTQDTNTRKLSELSRSLNNQSLNVNIKPGKESINSTDNSGYSSPRSINTNKKTNNTDIAPDIASDILIPQLKHITNPQSHIDKHIQNTTSEYMGTQVKPIPAIIFDYIIVCIFGAIYYFIIHYTTIRPQCIPGNTNNHSYCSDDITMNSKTPFLAYPHRSHPVPVSFPYIFGGVTWLGVLLIGICLLRPNLKQFKTLFIKIEALWREVLTSVMITQTMVGFIKTFIGRPRPNYYEYVSIDSMDAISSFPSGHASSSFCIHILLVYHVIGSIYWSYTNHANIVGADNMHALFGAKIWQKTRHCSSFNVLLVMCLLALPVWISCTRITDYYHNYSDVIGGALVGVLISTIVFSIFHNELYPHNQFYNKSAREPLLSNIGSDE